jgi:cytidine deaminase
MNDIVLQDGDAIDKHLIKMDKVVTEYLKGNSPNEIAQATGISPRQVGLLLKEWRGLAANNEAMKSRALLALKGADVHYDKLIKKAYEVMEDAEVAQSLSQRISSIKLIADMEARRIDLLQKAGALEDTDISKQIAETERKQAILMDVLKNTVGPCKRCRPIVQERLAEVTRNVVVIKADE